MRRKEPEGRPIGTLAIVGRPNTGKSTLFNRLTGRRRALVDRRPGITRDRLYGSVEWRGRSFRLIDTGGLDPDNRDPLLSQMRRQVEVALREADAVLFLVDGREGLLPEDAEIARRLRAGGLRVLVGVNKVETDWVEGSAQEFHRLGFGGPWFVSGEEGRGLADLLDEVLRVLGEAKNSQGGEDGEDEAGEAPPRIAIVGRPNVGKSSLVNRLLGQDRVVVHDVPGTTRDSVDSLLRWRGGSAVLVDTAGIRKRAAVRDKIEFASSRRAIDSLRDADVAVLVLEAPLGFTQLDVQIAGEIQRAGAGMVIACNKWDLVEGREEEWKALLAEARERIHFADYAPVVALSARTGEKVGRILTLVERVARNRRQRIATSALNRFLIALLGEMQPPAVKGKEFRPKYLTQVGVAPPTFVVFTGKAIAPPPQFGRFLEKRLREVFGFEGTPIRIRFRTREPREPLPGTDVRRDGRPGRARPPRGRKKK